MTKAELKRLRAIMSAQNAATEKRLQQVEAALDSLVEDISERITVALVSSLDYPLDGSQGAQIERVTRSANKAWADLTRWVIDKIGDFVDYLLGIAEDVAQYFDALGFSATGNVSRLREFVSELIGVSKGGEIFIFGDFMHNLSTMSPVREQVLNFARYAAATGVPYAAYQSGVKDLIQKNGIVGDYFRRYAYDAYNEVREAANIEMAETLNLRYFIYEGSVIKTTRAFCKKKAGKVFSTDEAKKWKDDKDLIEPSTKASYMPLMHRGRYNCRHFINYISDELAYVLRPDLKVV